MYYDITIAKGAVEWNKHVTGVCAGVRCVVFPLIAVLKRRQKRPIFLKLILEGKRRVSF